MHTYFVKHQQSEPCASFLETVCKSHQRIQTDVFTKSILLVVLATNRIDQRIIITEYRR